MGEPDLDRSENRGRKSLTRRAALGGAVLIGAGAAIDHVLDGAGGRRGEKEVSIQRREVDFFGAHQAGIGTPAPEFLSFASFDFTAGSADELRSLLMVWTDAAARMSRGDSIVSSAGSDEAAADTDEALGLGPSSLTVTFGFGRSLFVRNGVDRLGLARRMPSQLIELPAFPRDELQSGRSDGDLCIQACASDAQVAFHAIHTLARLGSELATLRWTQQGFGRTSSTSRSQPTPRNLLGFKDGTANIRAEDVAAMDRFVWAQSRDQPTWMTGGTYLITRRIQMLLDVWDATTVEGQERAVGRSKIDGAPLGRRSEYDALDLEAEQNGQLTIPRDAHVRLASPQSNDGQRLLRRGYSYNESIQSSEGQINAGLFFICFQRDPRRQFVPIQRRLSRSDALNRHLRTTASALFACPPGAQRGGFVGEGIFA